MTRTKQLLATLLSIVLVTSVGLVATGGFAGAQSQEGTAAVTIEDQPSDGQTVIVDSVTLPEGGFVVIHDDSLADGDAIGSVIGISRYLEAGTHEGVPVTVAPEFDTAADIDVTAMAHEDTNGNEVFDFVTSEGSEDGPYLVGGEAETATPETEEAMTTEEAETPMETETTEGAVTTEAAETTEAGATTEETTAGAETTEGAETTAEETTEAETVTTETEVGTETTEVTAQVGDPVVDEAVIDATAGQVPNASLQISDQTSDGTTVTVDQVTLYRGGYVVIHDTEELADGDATGSVVGNSQYLEPGTYEDVEVTLARPLDLENESEVSVTAMPHFDTNQNLVFDFVTAFGSADDPYLDENESAVVASATVTAGMAENETEEAMTPEETTEMPTETETAEENETEAGTETTEEAGTTEGTEETTEPAGETTEETTEGTVTTEEATTEAGTATTETP